MCPASHPYVIGGGASGWFVDGGGTVPLVWSGPITADNTSEGNVINDSNFQGFGWIGIVNGSGVAAWALCAK